MEINNVIIPTPCRVTFDTSTNNTYKYFYIYEFFNRDKLYIQDFLSQLIIKNGKTNLQGIDIFTAEGKNNILYVYSHDRDVEIKQAENSEFCYLTKNTINNIISKTPIDNYYRRFWLDLLFSSDSSEIIKFKNANLYCETDDMIMIPDTNLYYINKQIYGKIKKYMNKKKNYVNKMDDILTIMKDIVFTVIVKPDNYEELKPYYPDNIHYIKEELIKSEFKNMLFIKDYEKLLRVKNSINKYYYDNYGIYPEQLHISCQDSFTNNFWINIKVAYRNIYDGEYLYYRLTYIHRHIELNDLIKNIKVGKSLDNMFQRSFNYTLIDEYNIENCIPNSGNKKRDLHLKYYGKFDNELSKKYNIINNNKLRQFTVDRVFYNRISKMSTMCAISACCTINNEHYLVNIIPRTVAFVSNLWKYNKPLLNKYIFDYENNNDFVCYKNSVCLDYVTKHNLKYNLEVVNLGCYDCDGIKNHNDCINNKYIKNLVEFSVKKQKYLELKENGELAEKYIDNVYENFKVGIYIIFYSIIASLFRINTISLNQKEDILNKIISIEEYYNLELHKLVNEHTIEDNDVFMYSNFGKKETFFYKKILGYNSIEDLFNNKHFIKYFGNDYIFVPSPEYISSFTENDDDNVYDATNSKFKYLMWYIHFKFSDISAINNTVDILANIVANKINYYRDNIDVLKRDKHRVTLDYVFVNKDNLEKMYDISNLRHTYNFNIISLFDNNKKNTEKYNSVLNNIELFKKNINVQYLYTFFHYPIQPQYNTLHIHIYTRYTIGSTRRRRFYYGSNYVYETVKYEMQDLLRLSNPYYNDHIIGIDISEYSNNTLKSYNINQFVNIIKNKMKNYIYNDYITDLIEYNKEYIHNYFERIIS